MRKLVALALAGLFGSFFAASDASACHKKKCATPCETVVAAPVCAPAPVCVPPPAPVCEPAPVVCEAPKAKKCHFKMPKMKFGCHKKAACETVSYTAYAPTTYAAPQSYASPQGY